MKLRTALAACLLTVTFLSPLPASAVSVTASNTDANGLCTQVISSSSSVTITRSGSECIIRFAPISTTTYTWTRPSGVTSFRVLIVAGGGGGGSNYGGGGGGGGFIDTTTAASTSSISITVGGGGAGSLNGNSTDASNGSNSSFVGTTTLTAVGGGRAGSADLTAAGASGGSGGGGGGVSGSGGSATTNQGFAGGRANYIAGPDTVSTGGGGGAGGVGGDGRSTGTALGGSGGAGKSSDITGSTLYYAGGGGGGTHTGSGGTCAGTAAGSHGGGMAGTCKSSGNNTGNPGTSGTNGTGGGGGGGSVFTGRTSAAYGGNGGSGIVIVRFTADVAPVITGPSSATGSTSSISITENTTTVFTFSANEAVTWSLSGVDSATFTITSSGVLTTSAKDFEAPTDSDTNNTYIVVITATDSLSLVTTQTLTVTVTNLNEVALVGNPSVSGLIYKGTSTIISITANTPANIRFFVNGKRISGCLARATTGSYPSVSASCSWKPAVTGANFITAVVTPIDTSFSSVTSGRTNLWVLKRSGTR